MSVGGPEEKTTTIAVDAQGRFHHKTYEKGLHFLNFVGVDHQQQKVVLFIDEPRTVSLNARLLPVYYKVDAAEARIESKRKALILSRDGETLTLETPLNYRIRPASLRLE